MRKGGCAMVYEDCVDEEDTAAWGKISSNSITIATWKWSEVQKVGGILSLCNTWPDVDMVLYCTSINSDRLMLLSIEDS